VPYGSATNGMMMTGDNSDLDVTIVFRSIADTIDDIQLINDDLSGIYEEWDYKKLEMVR
jgi:hypothetical protein